MKNYLLSLVLFLLVSTVFAAPTIEGLFRNGNNPDLSGNLVVATFLVEELPTEVAKQNLPPRYVKIYMSRSGNKVELVQTDYADNRFNETAIQRLYYNAQLSDDAEQTKVIERSLFYNVMASLLLNDSRPMNHFLKTHATAYKTNRELMNSEKVELLQKYKSYLIAVSEEGGSVKDAIKASKQGSAEERAKAMDTISSGVYDKTDHVRLTREAGQFYWAVDLGQIKALFSNEEHRLKKIQMTLDGGKNIEMECGEYVLMNGTHELPRNIALRDSSNSLYRITFLSLNHMSDKSGQQGRASKFEGLVKANKNKGAALKFSQSFLY